MRSHDDDGHIRAQGLNRGEQLHAAELRHHQVGENHVSAVLLELSECLFTILCERDVVPIFTQHGRQHLAQIHLVIDDQNP